MGVKLAEAESGTVSDWGAPASVTVASSLEEHHRGHHPTNPVRRFCEYSVSFSFLPQKCDASDKPIATVWLRAQYSFAFALSTQRLRRQAKLAFPTSPLNHCLAGWTSRRYKLPPLLQALRQPA